MIDEILNKLKQNQPEYKTKLPVLGKEITYSPYKMRDQKTISLISEQSNIGVILKNICNIIKSCSNVEKPELLYLADLEFLFLQIRSKSVEENIKLQIEGDPPILFNLNVSEIKYQPGELSKKILVNNNVQVELKQPTVAEYFDLEELDESKLLIKSIKGISINKIRYDLQTLKSEVIQKIVDEIVLTDSIKLTEFIKNAPRLTYAVLTENDPVLIEGFLRFFT